MAVNSIDWQSEVYPMDFYSADSLGPWTPNHQEAAKASKGDVKIEEMKCGTKKPSDDGCASNCHCDKK